MSVDQDEKQKEIPITMNGLEVMNYLSLDQQKLCFLAKEEHLVPYAGIHPSWFKLLINSPDELSRRSPKWLYLKSDVESFKLNNKEYLEELRPQKTSVLSDPQKPSKPKQGYFNKLGKKGGERPKKNKPILIAITQFLQKGPKRVNMTNEQIFKNFKRIATEKNPYSVNCDGCEWDIYCDDEGDGYIIAKTYEKKIKKPQTSIKAVTFKNYYIRVAKKII